MSGLSLRRVFLLAGLISLALIYAALWTRMLADFEQRTGSDFIGIYSFGRIAQTAGFPHIYDLGLQEAVQEELLGFQTTPQYYTHVPYIAPLAALVTSTDHAASFQRWGALLLVLNALNAFLLVRTLGLPAPTAPILALYAATFLFFPTFTGFMNGQDDAILVLGAALWLLGLFAGRDFLAGLGLSLTTVRPQLALFLVIPFLFRRRRVFWGFAAGAAALGLFSLAFIGLEGAFGFVRALREIEGTIWHAAHALDMPTLSGILRRNFEFADVEPVKLFVWSCYFLGIAAFSLIWLRGPEIGERHLGWLALSAIFLAPYLHYQEVAFLLIPLFCLMRLLHRWNLAAVENLALLPLAVSLLTLIGFTGPGLLKFPIVYLLMAATGCFLLAPERIGRFTRQPAR